MRQASPFRAAALALALIAPWSACRTLGPHAAVDPDIASCIPADTLALAGVNLEQFRASALYQKLPPGASAFLAPLRDASYLLLAYNGKDVLAVARGAFREPPAGAVLLAKDLAVSGSAQAVRAATAQHKTGRTGVPWLLSHAAEVAGASQVWVVAQGGVTFPLSGDAANLNKFLSLVDYASVAIHLDSGVRIDVLGAGRTPESAEHLEENLRAFFSLAAAGAQRDRALADVLHSVQVQRDGLTVRAGIAASPEEIAKLAGLAAP
jgi:hypothetical protein